MSEDKYFTPSIEDIRVGYECEMKYGDTWQHQVITTWMGRDGEGDIPDAFYALRKRASYEHDKPEDCIRVPYLTKEQVRDDGWKVITPSSNLTKEGVFYFEKGNYFLIADFSRPIPFLDFILRDPSKDLDKVGNPERFRFYCECKDINTFRYICKLLGI